MRRISIAVGLWAGLIVGACGGHKKAEAPPEDAGDRVECRRHSDCESGMRCLGNECVSPASGAIYTDPSNAVTPDKMKREVEQIQEQHTERVDESLDL